MLDVKRILRRIYFFVKETDPDCSPSVIQWPAGRFFQVSIEEVSCMAVSSFLIFFKNLLSEMEIATKEIDFQIRDRYSNYEIAKDIFERNFVIRLKVRTREDFCVVRNKAGLSSDNRTSEPLSGLDLD